MKKMKSILTDVANTFSTIHDIKIQVVDEVQSLIYDPKMYVILFKHKAPNTGALGRKVALNNNEARTSIILSHVHFENMRKRLPIYNRNRLIKDLVHVALKFAVADTKPDADCSATRLSLFEALNADIEPSDTVMEEYIEHLRGLKSKVCDNKREQRLCELIIQDQMNLIKQEYEVDMTKFLFL